MFFFPFYLVGFLLTIVALVAWFYFQRSAGASRFFGRLVLAGLGIYALGVLLAGGGGVLKMSVLFRDLLLIGGAGLVFQLLVRQRPAFFFGLLALGAVLLWYYQNYMRTAWEPLVVQTAQLDPNAELLVELKDGLGMGALRTIIDRYDLEYEPAFTLSHPERTDLDDYYAVNVPDGMADRLPAIERALRKSVSVDWVEPNEVINLDPEQPAKLPDPIRKRFGIDDPGLEFLWSFDKLGVDQLYTYLREQSIKPRQRALIAILDTGVDAKHEDLSDNYKSIQAKYDDDPRGHGTHCAGIAAAVSNNGKGVASFSHNNEFVQVASIKVLSAMGSGTQRTIVNGMLEAADRGAAVISMSLGGISNQSRQQAYEKAVAYANKAGTIVVAAAGNSNRNARDYAPVNAEGIIGVSAVDNQLNRAVFSNYVSDLSRGIAAPGVDIYSTIPGNQYATFSGTSMATPYVAGLVGLLKAIQPSLTTDQVYGILRQSGSDTKATAETGKLIRPYEAVQLLVNGR